MIEYHCKDVSGLGNPSYILPVLYNSMYFYARIKHKTFLVVAEIKSSVFRIL